MLFLKAGASISVNFLLYFFSAFLSSSALNGSFRYLLIVPAYSLI